jgi:membrane-bound lytic murein transglycosylase A
VAAGKRALLPAARPSAKIAKLFPPKREATEPAKEVPAKVEPKPAPTQEKAAARDATVATTATTVPLPQARPEVAPQRRKKFRRYRR